MLISAFEQFYEEVNTGNDREQLKSLIAAIQIKRKLKKDHPGSDTLAKVVTQLEKQDYSRGFGLPTSKTLTAEMF
jgi:CII-binding regulator of phage lambda lysogenization HflD